MTGKLDDITRDRAITLISEGLQRWRAYGEACWGAEGFEKMIRESVSASCHFIGSIATAQDREMVSGSMSMLIGHLQMLAVYCNDKESADNKE